MIKWFEMFNYAKYFSLLHKPTNLLISSMVTLKTIMLCFHNALQTYKCCNFLYIFWRP